MGLDRKRNRRMFNLWFHGQRSGRLLDIWLHRKPRGYLFHLRLNRGSAGCLYVLRPGRNMEFRMIGIGGLEWLHVMHRLSSQQIAENRSHGHVVGNIHGALHFVLLRVWNMGTGTFCCNRGFGAGLELAEIRRAIQQDGLLSNWI